MDSSGRAGTPRWFKSGATSRGPCAHVTHGSPLLVAPPQPGHGHRARARHVVLALAALLFRDEPSATGNHVNSEGFRVCLGVLCLGSDEGHVKGSCRLVTVNPTAPMAVQ